MRKQINVRSRLFCKSSSIGAFIRASCYLQVSIFFNARCIFVALLIVILNYLYLVIMNFGLRGSLVECRSLVGELSLSCDRPIVNR